MADQLGNLLSRASGAALLPDQAWPQPREFTDADRRVLDALDGLPGRMKAKRLYAIVDCAHSMML